MQIDQTQLQPFRDFQIKINQDLHKWLNNQKIIQELLEDYKSTLNLLENQYDSKKIMVDLGENCFLKAKRDNNNIILRVKEDIYIEFNKIQAIPITKQLIKLYQQKQAVCKQEICKIMASMREMQSLIRQYQTVM